MNFCVVNLGCKVNRVESDAFAAALLARGGVAVDETQAELIVVNTCTVTGEAEKKTRKAVRRALRSNERAIVAVTGCAVAIDAGFYENMDERVRALAKNELLQLIEQNGWGEAGIPCAGSSVAEESADQRAATIDPKVDAEFSAKPSAASAPIRVGEGFRTRVGVKVQDGCDNACTYCIVHVARGRATTRPVDEVLAETVAQVQAGAREIVLTGINIGSYCDGEKRSADAVRLTGLLERLLDATAELTVADEPPARFRISSIEPRDVDDALIDMLATSNGRICRHLHLPLQSGSSAVLRAMARPYDAERFAALVDDLRARVPQISLSTDIIVGFPGETEADFQETLAMARRCAFSKIHVFPYSQREGTPAATRADQIPAPVKAARAETLRALGEELRQREFAARSGSVELALVEDGGHATTESYYEVDVPANMAIGALVPVRL